MGPDKGGEKDPLAKLEQAVYVKEEWRHGFSRNSSFEFSFTS